MIRPEKMPVSELTARLEKRPGWSYDESKKALFRHFLFKDFSEAWGFMNRIALEAEKLDHHPSWFNEYNKVDVYLSTHDVGGVTQLDFALARAIDEKL